VKLVTEHVTALVVAISRVALILMTLSLRKLKTRSFDAIATALTKPKKDQKWILRLKQVLQTSSSTQMQTYQSNHNNSGKDANLFFIWT